MVDCRADVAAPVGSGKEAAVIGNVPPAPVTSQAVVFAVFPGCTVNTPLCVAAIESVPLDRLHVRPVVHVPLCTAEMESVPLEDDHVRPVDQVPDCVAATVPETVRAPESSCPYRR